MSNFWKDKKILVYIALAHHTRFISPVMDQLTLYGATVKYIVGQAERSQEITAINLGLTYTHVFDYLSERDQADIQKNYGLLRNELSNNLKTSCLYSATPTTVTDKTIYSTAMEYIGFRNLLRKEKPDLCFALHELNRWGKMFSFWSKKFNVPILTFQEGLYYGFNYAYTGHLQYSTFNLVWGKRVKNKLMDFESPGDRILKTGNTHLANEIKVQKENRVREKTRKRHNCQNAFAILLLFSGTIPDIHILHPIFRAMAESNDKKLFIKFHPSTRYDQVKLWISLIPEEYKSVIKPCFGDENVYDLLSMSDVVTLIQPSTTGLEALFFGKPLVHIDLKPEHHLPYSFTEFKVAANMTPEEFGAALAQNTDFAGLTRKEDIQRYLENELSETRHAIDKVQDISKKLIQANQTPNPTPLQPQKKADRDWSLILTLSEDPKTILKQLESLSVNSENCGTFEVILIEPFDISKEVSEILDTMKGNLTRLTRNKGQSTPEVMNTAALIATGEILVFMKESMVPMPNWLYYIEKGIQKYGKNRIFGARILNKTGSILHAGVVLDKNNSPVSSYQHLPAEFPNAIKERGFQMVDHVAAMSRNFFYRLGGFWEKAGSYALMDICLRASNGCADDNCIFLPEVCLVALEKQKEGTSDDAIHFYGKWHGRLWENQTQLYKKDRITDSDIDTARLTQSMISI